VRWDELFADLEAQLAAAEDAELAGEVADRTRGEVGGTELVDRARSAVGTPLRVQVVGHEPVAGMLLEVGSEWLLMRDAQGRDVLVPWSAVLALVGLGAATADRAEVGPTFRRLGLSPALRALARDRAGVAVGLVDGTVVTGTVDRVGRDFFDLSEHPRGESRRAREVSGVRVIRQQAVATVTQQLG
jgi:hypothetical protein